MRELSVVGGIYLERCIQPLWDAVYGSAGRATQAAAAIAKRPVQLYTYVSPDLEADAIRLAAECGAVLHAQAAQHPVSFDYLHPLAVPRISPSPARIIKNPPIKITGDVILRYGMLEGDAIVDAEIAIFDPQSAFTVPKYHENGSRAKRLAVILNRSEARSMTGETKPLEAAQQLLRDGAEVVVVKEGALGALVVHKDAVARVPLYRTERVWKIGSGDVFSATFAALWGCKGVEAVRAADLASRATAKYCNTRSLPVPEIESLEAMDNPALSPGTGQIYLAGPFFDLGQRWLIEEARGLLRSMGAEVFSPVHEVGPGPAHIIAPADLKGLKDSQVVFAILNGLDPGTVFEVGYATKSGLPVIVLAQNIKDEDLKMVAGSGCDVVDDFATAIYHSIWALPCQ